MNELMIHVICDTKENKNRMIRFLIKEKILSYNSPTEVKVKASIIYNQMLCFTYKVIPNNRIIYYSVFFLPFGSYINLHHKVICQNKLSYCQIRCIYKNKPIVFHIDEFFLLYRLHNFYNVIGYYGNTIGNYEYDIKKVK